MTTRVEIKRDLLADGQDTLLRVVFVMVKELRAFTGSEFTPLNFPKGTLINRVNPSACDELSRVGLPFFLGYRSDNYYSTAP